MEAGALELSDDELDNVTGGGKFGDLIKAFFTADFDRLGQILNPDSEYNICGG